MATKHYVLQRCIYSKTACFRKRSNTLYCVLVVPNLILAVHSQVIMWRFNNQWHLTAPAEAGSGNLALCRNKSRLSCQPTLKSMSKYCTLNNVNTHMHVCMYIYTHTQAYVHVYTYTGTYQDCRSEQYNS